MHRLQFSSDALRWRVIVIYMSNFTGNERTFSLLIFACFLFLEWTIINSVNCSVWHSLNFRLFRKQMYLSLIIFPRIFVRFEFVAQADERKIKRNDFVVRRPSWNLSSLKCTESFRSVEKWISASALGYGLYSAYAICVCAIAFLFLTLLLDTSSLSSLLHIVVKFRKYVRAEKKRAMNS